MRARTALHRVIAAAAAVSLVGCSGAPKSSATLEPTVAVVATTGPAPSAVETEPPTATTLPGTPALTPRPSDSPLALLAPELAEIAWATRDGEHETLSIGLLGRPASIVRPFADWSATIRPSGRFVLVHPHDADVELIDVVSGETVARLSLPGARTSHGWLDPSGTYVYVRVEDAHSLLEIRRIRLDGTEDVRFALLDTVRDGVHWSGSFFMADDGTTFVVTCPHQGQPGSEATGRCRLAVAPPGAEPGSGSFLLPADLPHPCWIHDAGGGYVFVHTMAACDADGGFLPISFIAIRASDGAFDVIEETKGIDNEDAMLLIDGQPFLLARRSLPSDDGDWNPFETVKRSFGEGDITPLVPASLHRDPAMRWVVERVLGDDAIVVGYGTAHEACRRQASDPYFPDCPADAAAVWNPTLDRFIPLPIDTYGDVSTLSY